MPKLISVVIKSSGWVFLCHIEQCPQSMVIRHQEGEVAQAILHAFHHVMRHHFSESVEIHCNHKEMLDMVLNNSNPENSVLVSEVNALYRAMPRCVLKLSSEQELSEAFRLARLIPYLRN